MHMKEKKTMSKFQKGFAVYVGIWLVLILMLWFAAWNYAGAYELAQPKGAMNAYMEESLHTRLVEAADAYSAERANAYQSAEEIRSLLDTKLVDGEWTYRKSKEFTSAAPVYTLYCGELPMGSVTLTPGEAKLLDFGLAPWQVQPVALNLEQLEKTVTVVAPVGTGVTLNGAAMSAGETVAFYPDFAEYELTIKQPMELAVYRAEKICLDEIAVDCGGLQLVEAEDPYTYYAVPAADEVTAETLETLAPRFAEAYLKYSANADTYYSVSQFVAPGSELLERLYKSRDGMSWVSYTTGRIVKCEVSEVTYFGNVATYDVDYVLDIKSGEMAGKMHVICVHADFGWRVTDIEMF